MPQYQNDELAKLLQLAQIQGLLGQPEQADEELEQREQAARMHAAIQLMGLQHQQQQGASQQAELVRYHQAEEEQRKAMLAETVRQHDLGLKQSEGRDRVNMFGEMARTLGVTDPAAVREIAKRVGGPDVVAGFDAADKGRVAVAADKLEPMLGALVGEGGVHDPTKLATFQSGVPKDVWQELMRRRPQGGSGSWDETSGPAPTVNPEMGSFGRAAPAATIFPKLYDLLELAYKRG